MSITINNTPDLNIIINQGEYFAADLLYTNPAGAIIDLTGYTATMKVRDSLESESILLTMTTANTKIVIAGVLGKITIIVNETDSLSLPLGRLVYDFLLINGAGKPDRFFKGTMMVGKMVSRA